MQGYFKVTDRQQCSRLREIQLLTMMGGKNKEAS